MGGKIDLCKVANVINVGQFIPRGRHHRKLIIAFGSKSKKSLIDAEPLGPFLLGVAQRALTKAFRLTPRDTDVSWSPRDSEAGRLATIILTPGETMKMPEKYAADPKTVQEIHAFVREYEERFNKSDAVALAELLTEDAIQITPEGPICGREAIQKKDEDLFKQSHPTDIICTVDWVNAVGDVSWNGGEWSCTLQSENGPVRVKGYRLDVLVREGDAWKECMSCYNMTPPSAWADETK
jgi:uncharacterized protein (TIGR02246 family)